jgi:Uma2 family endonuclease
MTVGPYHRFVISLLDSPAVRERVHPMSIEVYHRMCEIGALSEDVELLQGIVITKMAKSPLHEYVVHMLMKLLFAMLPSGFELRCESPLTLGNSEPEPNLSVVKGDAADWLRAHPTTAALVIEVAVTSAAIDESKAVVYAEAGIPEYWIVHPEQRIVTVYREPASAGYRSCATLTDDDTFRSVELTGVEIPVAAVLPPKA